MRFYRFLPLCFLLLSGCSILDYLVYKIPINQGNYIEQSDVNKLRYGMTKEQVEYIFGKNMLNDPTRPDTWSYVQYIKEGNQNAQAKRLFITFNKKGRLIHVTGDYLLPNLGAQISADE